MSQLSHFQQTPDAVVSSSPPIDPRRLQVHREAPHRDVPYVPTDEPVVAAMLRFAGITSGDVIYDLGCGDGRICIAAAKHYGARAVGVDIDPLRIQESRENAKKTGAADRTRFLCQSFFDTDLRDATVVFLYLLPAINVKLRPKLLWELRPGTRVIANNFDIGDWPADIRAEAHHRVLMQWIVPAWVGGTWKCVLHLPEGNRHMTLFLHRHYQSVDGTAYIGRRELPIWNGKLFGEQLSFKLMGAEEGGHTWRFHCTVNGSYLRGGCQREALDEHPIPWGGVWAAGA